MTTSDYIPYRQGRWQGLVHRQWASILAQNAPLQWLDNQPHEEANHRRPSKKIYRVDATQGDVYFKVILGVNDRSVGSKKKLIDTLKWRYRPSRAIATLKVSDALLHAGLDCPLPILAAREYAGKDTRDVFISQAVDLLRLSQVLGQASVDDRRPLIQATAGHIARLHQQRFLHGDLLPNNLHVTADVSRLYFLDNDRTRRWPVPLPGVLVRRNLAQMAYRLHIFQSPTESRMFLLNYGQARGWSESQTATCVEKVLKAVEWRLAHKPGPKFIDTPRPPNYPD